MAITDKTIAFIRGANQSIGAAAATRLASRSCKLLPYLTYSARASLISSAV